MDTKEDTIDYLKKHYPNEDTKLICEVLGLSISAVYSIATRNGINKNKEYLKVLHEQLLKKKEEKYLAAIPNVSLTQLEQNIIIGSILGDGNLTFSQRSRNAYYREHFSIKQMEYRVWKMNSIHSLNFRIEGGCHLKSPSHPIFTNFYKQFFINSVKTITCENIKLLDHPIGLACLYLDDGTLMINVNKGKKNIRVSSVVGIATLCFSKSECELLIEHIYKIFNIQFYISSYPGGKGWNIKIYKSEEIAKFYNLILPYCREIPSLRYKWDLQFRLEDKKQKLFQKYKESYNVKISSIENITNYYSIEEESIICNMKREDKTYKEIAYVLGRSYFGIGYKIGQLKKQYKI